MSVQRVIQDHQSAVRQPEGFTVKGFRYSEVPKEVSLWAWWEEADGIDWLTGRGGKEICGDVTREVIRGSRSSTSSNGSATSGTSRGRKAALIFFVNHWEETKKYQCTPIE